ncbi:liprin-alpha-1-like isoform X1 [Rhopilema esculentum]|uniref:liprin-alpha-1-like isoform X1 n=1 Tax=Rhopilema esculentum TaxID=499914 RepID=UPI0031D2AA55
MMMCGDIMPTISETGDNGNDGAMEDNNFEQLMVNMLDERDKLMETLREAQENLAYTRNKLKETELEKDALLQKFEILLSETKLDREQLLKKLGNLDSLKISSNNEDMQTTSHRLRQPNWSMAEEFVTMAKEIFQMREKLTERDEEVAELKAERSNIKLLLEHLECLVSRHERSLRMTVVKRQAQTSAGVSSEVEVLKALKSLFEHHKALDEKVRERLRIALDKAKSFEEELTLSNQEIERLREENRQLLERRERQRSLANNQDGGKITNGPATAETNEDLQEELSDMQYKLDQRDRDLEKIRKDCKESKDRVNTLEEQLAMASRQLNSAHEAKLKFQRDIEEVLAQKADMEERIITLEKRYVRSQNELASSSECNERTLTELKSFQMTIAQKDEKINNLQEQLSFCEQRFHQLQEKAEALPKIEEELANRVAALNEAEERNFTAEERLQQLQTQQEELTLELTKLRQREKTMEEHSTKLQARVDKLLRESNERLQQHLKERMSTLEEKNAITQELDRTKRALESLQLEKGSQNRLLTLRTQASNGEPLTDEQKVKKREERARVRSLEGDPTKILTINEQEWEKLTQATVVSTVAQAFDAVSVNEDDAESVKSERSSLKSQDLGLPKVPKIDDAALESLSSGDAQHLANVLQQQLDAINKELALLQVEHRTTELRAEEIERQVGSETSSLDEISVTSSTAASDHSLMRPEDRTRRFSGDSYNRRKASNDATETGTAFPFTSHDPLDTRPLMLRVGRSQERLEGEGRAPDTPGSLPSDSTESGGDNAQSQGLSVPGWANFEPDRESRSGFDFSSSPSSLSSSMESIAKRNSKRGLKNSLGRIFSSKSKLRTKDASMLLERSVLNSDHDGQRDAERRIKQKLLEDVIHSRTPFASWNAPTILAWLELWLKLPDWYIAACRANVKSGSIMSALSDTEIQHEIGVNNPLHRLKLRLAIHEMVNVTSPMAPPTAKTSLVFGDMNHFWIAHEWLPSLGLSQYRSTFLECLVDARMLEHISKKEFQKYLKVVDGFHRNSIILGTKCLEMLNYDRRVMERRRRDCEKENKDVLVWSNERMIKWVCSIGLDEFAYCLQQSGIHGAVVAMDETFDVGSLTYYLQIPSTNTQARQILEMEFAKLTALCPDRLLHADGKSDLGDGDFKRSRSWRKKFKKERGRDRRDHPTLTRRGSTESDISQQSGSSGSENLNSPAHRNKKSPLVDRRIQK